MEEYLKIIYFITGMLLVVLSVEDIRYKAVPVWQVVILGVIALAGSGILVYKKALTFNEMAMGLIPGILMVIIALITGCFGVADGIVLAFIGTFMGVLKTLVILGGAFFIMSLFSVIGLALGKIKLKYQMPFIPFMLVAFIRAAVI